MYHACNKYLPSKLTWWGPELGAKDKVDGQFSNSMPSCSNDNPMSLTSIGRGLYKVKQTSETSLATHWKLTFCFCSFPPKLRGVKTKTLSLFFLCPFPILGTRWLGRGHTEKIIIIINTPINIFENIKIQHYYLKKGWSTHKVSNLEMVDFKWATIKELLLLLLFWSQTCVYI